MEDLPVPPATSSKGTCSISNKENIFQQKFRLSKSNLCCGDKPAVQKMFAQRNFCFAFNNQIFTQTMYIFGGICVSMCPVFRSSIQIILCGNCIKISSHIERFKPDF